MVPATVPAVRVPPLRRHGALSPSVLGAPSRAHDPPHCEPWLPVGPRMRLDVPVSGEVTKPSYEPCQQGGCPPAARWVLGVLGPSC
eukprot:5278752-Alexandrium_andersonii.AAC.1